MKSFVERLRTLFILGRVSNLPTVWSNLIVGWILADGPRVDYIGRLGPDGGPDVSSRPLSLALLGGSLLYIGGMYLNDYCDAAFDARYCIERPIPTGKISRHLVGLLAVLWLTAGLAVFAQFGPVTIGIALFLIVFIAFYDFHHKNVAWAPIVMGLCRCLLYLLAASSYRESVWFNSVYGDWWDSAEFYMRNVFWGQTMEIFRQIFPFAIPLGLYVAGITYVARGESRPGKPTRWAYLLLLLAIIVPVRVDIIWIWSRHWVPGYAPFEYLRVLVSCLLLLGWMAWLLIPFWRKAKASVGRVVSGLLAGIVLLDMIVLALRIGPFYAIILFSLFLFALLLQRVIPAT